MSHSHATPASDERIHEELASEEHGHEHHVHVTPYWPMLIVFVTLCFLTVFTVLTAKYVHLPGNGNLLLALVIATFKASLVFAYFMHLRYDKLLNTVVVAASMFALLLFIGFTAFDIGARDEFNRQYEQGEIMPGGLDSPVAKANAAARQQALEHGHGDHDGAHDEAHGEADDHATDDHGDAGDGHAADDAGH